MAQNLTAAASLGAPRRHRDSPSETAACGGNVGPSISARFGETEWEAREVKRF